VYRTYFLKFIWRNNETTCSR